MSKRLPQVVSQAALVSIMCCCIANEPTKASKQAVLMMPTTRLVFKPILKCQSQMLAVKELHVVLKMSAKCALLAAAVAEKTTYMVAIASRCVDKADMLQASFCLPFVRGTSAQEGARAGRRAMAASLFPSYM